MNELDDRIHAMLQLLRKTVRTTNWNRNKAASKQFCFVSVSFRCADRLSDHECLCVPSRCLRAASACILANVRTIRRAVRRRRPSRTVATAVTSVLASRETCATIATSAMKTEVSTATSCLTTAIVASAEVSHYMCHARCHSVRLILWALTYRMPRKALFFAVNEHRLWPYLKYMEHTSYILNLHMYFFMQPYLSTE